MEAVRVSNVLGILFCFLATESFLQPNLAWRTDVGNTELPLDDDSLGKEQSEDLVLQP